MNGLSRFGNGRAGLLGTLFAGTLSVCINATGVARADPAADYPTRQVRILVHVTPGGGTDVAARFVAERLTESLGQTFFVENRPGAGGRVILEMAAKAAPDGYTLSVSPTGAMYLVPALYKNVAYDPVRDFAPISNLVGITLVLTTGSTSAFNSLADIVAYSKKKGVALDYASPGGAGTLSHIATEMVQAVAGVKLMMIPYKGIADAHSDLISGRIPLMVDALSAALPQIRAGRLRAIAVFSAERNKLTPEIPTIAESGFPGFDAASTVGLVAPAKTPPAILDKLHREIVRVLAQPAAQERLLALGFLPQTNPSRAAHAAFIQSETQKWGAAIRAANIKVE
jgi:tripartite-type tricarboxylate transporter receptor subunit TctC